MTIAKDFASKAAVAFVAFAMIFSMFAPSAKAQSSEDLQKMINDLLAQIAGLQSQVGQGGNSVASGICPYTWTRDLNVGAQGADVMKLQQFLNANADTRVSASGAGSVGAETEFYGPATAAAVSKMQVMYRADILTPAGLVNPTGYYGPSTRAKANSLCTSAPVVVPPVDGEDDEDMDDEEMADLEGGEGYIDLDTLLDSNVTIDLGDSEEVLAVEITAKDSDVSIDRVDFMFNARPWLYFDEVNLLVDGEEVASLSRSSDFSEVGSNYRARFTGLKQVVREDDVAEFTLELVVLDSMAGNRAGETVNVSMATTSSIRFVDAAGISETDGVAMSAVVSFDDTFGNGDMNLTVSDDSPENETIVLSETSRTSGVTAVEFEVEAEDSDVTVNDVTVVFDTTGNTVAQTLYRAKLYSGSTLLSTQSVTASTTVFDDIEFAIDEDDIATFRVEVEFNDGDTLAASSSPQDFTVVSVEVDAEDADFAALNDTLTVGETHTILVNGLTADIDAITTSTANEGKQLTITYTMDVTAYGDNFYISATGSTAFARSITAASGTVTVSPSQVTVSGVTKDSTSNTYKISKGQTKSVSISYIVTNTVGGFINATLDTLNYGSSTGTPTGSTSPLGAPDFEKADASVTAS